MQFPELFSYMLWDIELKFCIWLCFTVILIKFECRLLSSIFLWVMPLLELSILEMHSFPHFFLTCFDILSWNFAHDFVLMYNVLQSKFECPQFASILMGNMPLLGLRILKIHSFPHFSLSRFEILSWKIYIWYGFTVLQIKFQCRQFASIFVGVMHLLGLRILEIHSFPHFSPTC